jgi:hypothetical protein
VADFIKDPVSAGFVSGRAPVFRQTGHGGLLAQFWDRFLVTCLRYQKYYNKMGYRGLTVTAIGKESRLFLEGSHRWKVKRHVNFWDRPRLECSIN